MKNFNDYRPPTKDNLMWSANKVFEQQLIDGGHDGFIDGQEAKLIVKDHSNPLNEDKEDKKLYCLDEVNIKRGSMVNFKSEDWIVVTKIESNDVYKLSKIVRCNNVLKFQDDELNIHEIPCKISDKTSVYSDGVEMNKFLALQDDQIMVTIPNNEITKLINLEKRFIFDNSEIYKLTKIQKLTHPGLLHLVMTKSPYNSQSDRLDLNLADYKELPTTPLTPPTPTEINIYGDTTIQLNQTKTYTTDFGGNVIFMLKSDDGINNTDLASIVEVGGGSCKIKATNLSSKVNQWFRVSVSDGNIESFIRVQIKGLF